MSGITKLSFFLAASVGALALAGGLPVFRTVDVAMRTLGRWYEAQRPRQRWSGECARQG